MPCKSNELISSFCLGTEKRIVHSFAFENIGDLAHSGGVVTWGGGGQLESSMIPVLLESEACLSIWF